MKTFLSSSDLKRMIRKIISEKEETGKSGWHFDKKSDHWLTWEVDVTHRGKRIRQRGFATEKKAKEFSDDLTLKKKLSAFGIQQPRRLPTVEELFTRHLETITHEKMKRSARSVFNTFLGILPKNLTLDELKKMHFRDYSDKRLSDERRDNRKDERIKASTVQRELKFVSAAINSAGEYFASCENWTPPKTYAPPSPKEQTARIIESDEWKKLIDYLLADQLSGEDSREYLARRRVGLTFYFALLTGLRHGEICAVEKKNFDPAKRRLKAQRFKTKNSGIQWTTFEPLTESHLWVLEEAAKLHPESPYFFSLGGKIHMKNYQILKAVSAKLGIDYGRYAENGFVVHSARHTFATTLDQSGIDRTTSRDFTAHTQDAMFARYTHVTLNSKSKAMQTIENKFSLNKQESLSLEEIFVLVQSKQMNLKDFEREVTRNLLSTFG